MQADSRGLHPGPSQPRVDPKCWCSLHTPGGAGAGAGTAGGVAPALVQPLLLWVGQTGAGLFWAPGAPLPLGAGGCILGWRA